MQGEVWVGILAQAILARTFSIVLHFSMKKCNARGVRFSVHHGANLDGHIFALHNLEPREVR